MTQSTEGLPFRLDQFLGSRPMISGEFTSRASFLRVCQPSVYSLSEFDPRFHGRFYEGAYQFSIHHKLLPER